MKDFSDKISAEYLKQVMAGEPSALSPTQGRLCTPIIDRIYRKMLKGIRFRPIHVAEGMIIDGHHRYVAALIAGFDIESVPSATTVATKALDWQSVEFTTEDWDTEAKIRLLNEHDAHYNGLPLEAFIDLLK